MRRMYSAPQIIKIVEDGGNVSKKLYEHVVELDRFAGAQSRDIRVYFSLINDSPTPITKDNILSILKDKYCLASGLMYSTTLSAYVYVSRVYVDKSFPTRLYFGGAFQLQTEDEPPQPYVGTSAISITDFTNFYVSDKVRAL